MQLCACVWFGQAQTILINVNRRHRAEAQYLLSRSLFLCSFAASWAAWVHKKSRRSLCAVLASVTHLSPREKSHQKIYFPPLCCFPHATAAERLVLEILQPILDLAHQLLWLTGSLFFCLTHRSCWRTPTKTQTPHGIAGTAFFAQHVSLVFTFGYLLSTH